MSEDVKQRRLTTFDPATQLADEFPEWILCDYSIPFATEVVCWKSRVAIVDSSRYRDLDWSLSVVLAHLTLNHGDLSEAHDGGPFTHVQQQLAEGLAKLWLDMDLGLLPIVEE